MKIETTPVQTTSLLNDDMNKVKNNINHEKNDDVIKPWSTLPSPSNMPSFGGFWGKSKRKNVNSESSSSSHNSGFRLHHVPHISQGSERMGCWYACVRMLGNSITSGPRLGLPELFTPDAQGLQNREDVLQLMRNENLSEVSLPRSREFTLEQLGNLLCRHGPIMFGWQVPNGSWHMSVLTGTDNDNNRVIFHDPRQGPDMTMPLDYFNQRLAWQVPHAMLYSDN